MTNFLNDEEKMLDYHRLTKEDFLVSYPHLTETEYNLTRMEVNNSMYLDNSNTWRMECGCTEANVLDGNHNVCTNG